ncbi:MAG: HAD family hydrolase [Frankiaceae bacterium]|nr:HAD family hydrolase [Frankiaceae bacterium]
MSDSAAFFDLDKTIIATSSTLALGRSFYAAGLISRRDVVKGAYAKFVYHLGGADETRMDRMRDDLARTVTGWEESKVRAIIEATLFELIDPLVYDEAATLIEEHHAAGRDVVIVSSSGDEVVKPVGVMLGADHAVATRMVVEDGVYTGDLDFYAFGAFKAEAMRSLAAEHGWDLAACYAYSDSATDVPMLEAVGHPFAVNPDRALRREATKREWPILEFKHPVPLRSRFPRIPTPSKPLTVGIAGAAVVAAAGWQAARVRGRRAG